MTRKWHLSRYTQTVRDDLSGDLLLHNSFMGALARIPIDLSQDIFKYVKPGFNRYWQDQTDRVTFAEDLLAIPMVKELCTGGFFVPTDVDEPLLASRIIKEERNRTYGIIVLPHENCNFRCVYCYEKFKRNKMKPEVVSGLKAFVERKVKNIKVLSISWFGGEPLLARDIVYDLSDSFIKSCDSHDVTYKSGITTNGFFLTEDVFDELLKHRVTYYQITLDGPEQTHDKARKLINGKGTYKKIINNLMATKERQEDFAVTIRVNFNNENIKFMDQFFSELSPLKGDSRFHMSFHPVGRWGGRNDSVLDVCDKERIQNIGHDLRTQTVESGFSSKHYRDSLMPHGSVCYAGKESSVVIGSDGTLYKCTVALEDSRNHVGRLSESGYLKLDQSKWSLWTGTDGKKTEKCETCSFTPSCQSRACPLVELEQGEPPCPFTKTDYEQSVKFLASVK